MFKCKKCKNYVGMTFSDLGFRIYCIQAQMCPRCLVEIKDKHFVKLLLDKLNQDIKTLSKREDKTLLEYMEKCRKKYEGILNEGND